MFRITRGHHVQHIQFPYPVIRDLDDLEEEASREDAAPADATAAEGAGDADSTEATQ